MKKANYISGVIFALWIAFANHLYAQQADEPYVHIPSTISREAQAIFRTFPDPKSKPGLPAPDNVKEWKAVQQELEANRIAMQKAVVDSLQPTITELKLGGVPVLDIKPKNWKDNRKVLVYTHGGAYTFYSATPLFSALP